MLTSKQRAYLKSLAMNENPIIWLGKASLTPENTKNIDEALAARELIKIGVLNGHTRKSCRSSARRSSCTARARTTRRKSSCRGKTELFAHAEETFWRVSAGQRMSGLSAQAEGMSAPAHNVRNV